AVAEEAVKEQASAIVAYHPPLFVPIKKLVSGPGSTPAQRVALTVIHAGIAVYSPHTALDAASGGVTDWLADGVLDPSSKAARAGGEQVHAGADRRALLAHAEHAATQEVKIVTFVPAAEVETIRGALASAGAGLIGNYDVCSFTTSGTGTFRGNAESKPAVGAAGRLESIEEVRLEMVCSRRALGLALQTLRGFHPYEEPAVDVYPLEPRPNRSAGVGRRITLDTPASLEEICRRVKRHLGVAAVQLAAPGGDASREISRIGVVPGAGASVAGAALGDGCELFITGEMKHHEIAAAVASGMAVILGGHTATERGYLPSLRTRLQGLVPSVPVIISKADRDPVVLK
ncbi:MAG: Nif3-like dinuclear metal center hexameric protein, partial [Thermoleophilia bacterium]|nr:Nif3-like dinuclear metal center hexameric protein [Thermoleophilia bacterium]